MTSAPASAAATYTDDTSVANAPSCSGGPPRHNSASTRVTAKVTISAVTTSARLRTRGLWSLTAGQHTRCHDRPLENLPLAGRGARAAILIPCWNEAPTSGTVVRRFRQVLPATAIYVFDNGSSDATAQVAREAGGRVVAEPKRGTLRVVWSPG